MGQGRGRGGRPREAVALSSFVGLSALLLFGCLALCSPPAHAADGELIVAAAASLREPVEALARRHERTSGGVVRVSFGASSALAAQIRLGAPIDVFLSADARLVDGLEERGHVDPAARFAFASNRLVVLRRPDSVLRIDRASDLLQSGIGRIALSAAAVPVGRYAREWLAARGLLEPLERKLVTTEHARASLAAVEHGHADVAIVYATDARIARRATVAYRIPTSEQPAIVYTAAPIDRAAGAAAAVAFLEALRSEGSADLLRGSGFLPVPAAQRVNGR